MRQLHIGSILLCAASPCFAQTDLIGFNPESTIRLPSRAESVVFANDGTRVILATRSGALMGDAHGGLILGRFAKGAIRSVAISRDDKRLAAGGESGDITLAESGGAQISQSRVHRGAVLSLSFSPDGSRLVSSAADKTIVILDATSGRELSRLPNPANKPFVFAGFSAQNNSVVGVCENGLILEWDPATARIVRQMQDADTTVFAGALNGGGTLLAISTEFAKLNKAAMMRSANPSDFYRKERLAIYDLTQGKLVKEIDGVDGQHMSLSFSADSRYVSAGREKVRGNAISVYDAQRGVEVVSTGTQSGTLASAFSPDGQRFAQTTAEGNLALFVVTGVHRGTEVGDLRGTKYQITSKQSEPLLAPTRSVRLAVMDLEANGTDHDMGRAVADLIRNRINGTKNIEVIERRQWDQIVSEQTKEVASDRIDPITAVSLGKGKGISKMIFGSVNKLGTTLTINIRIIDVETLTNDGEREVICQRCALEDLPGAVALLKTVLVKE